MSGGFSMKRCVVTTSVKGLPSSISASAVRAKLSSAARTKRLWSSFVQLVLRPSCSS